MKRVALLALLIVPALSVAASRQACQPNKTPYFGEALAKHLARLNIAHELARDGTVCFPQEKRPQVEAATHEVSAYFYGAFLKAEDLCQEQAYRRSMTSLNRPYYVTEGPLPTFHLASFSPADRETNRQLLAKEQAKARAACGKKPGPK